MTNEERERRPVEGVQAPRTRPEQGGSGGGRAGRPAAFTFARGARIAMTRTGQASASRGSFQNLGIPEQETALCLDCQVVFSIRQRACPKCGGEGMWLISHWRRSGAWRSPRGALVF
jgi:hypothetical protein